MIKIESFLFQLSILAIYYNITTNITTSDLIPTNAERYKTKHARLIGLIGCFILLVLCSRRLWTFDFICNPTKGIQLINVAMR